jgi:aryl-phospho-beta-D-glucosidase BglC (GH1 family)
MYVGFQDDQNFRFAPDRQALMDQASAANATIFRITLDWSRTAFSRPAAPANPFDPEYRLDDVDEFVRNAQQRGAEVLISIWGTPGWANGNKGKNFAPNRPADLRAFATAIAARYSGRFAGYPRVRFFSVWNEPNLYQFLAPQFNARGRSVAPATYARLYAAAYAGIKAGNRQALVAIGETSPRGRDRQSPGTAQDSHSPGRFAELVASANRRLRFDAWAHHPYPTALRAKPTQVVRWPNVTFSTLRRFETSIDSWFRRRNVPIWITEYGHQTRPQRPGALPARTQAAYAAQAIALARRDARVRMFIWFIFRDSPRMGGLGDPKFGWEHAGGLLRVNGASKPSYARFARAAATARIR